MSVPLPWAQRWREPLQRIAARCQRGGAPSPLAVALAAAIALHLLALSALQLRQRRQPAAALPPPRDDTPELLQFSRQQTREPAIAPLSIRALAQLPPPPPPPLAAAAAAPKGASLRGGDLARKPSSSRRGPQPATRTAAAARRDLAPGGSGAHSPRIDPGLQAALGVLTRWQEGRDGVAVAAGEAGWPAPEKPEATQLALWKRLWEKAAPAPAGPRQPRPLPAGVELRRLAIDEGTPAPLPEEGRLSLVLGERLLLIWSSGGELWLLMAPANRLEADRDPARG